MPRGERGAAVKEYQQQLVDSLKTIFGNNNVEKEWNVAKNSRDDLNRSLYCPRLDIAVGPFHINRDTNYSDRSMSNEVSLRRRLIDSLFNYAEDSTGTVSDFIDNLNANPRCFLSIEIEDSGSRKHMLGDIANVSIIGLIGVIIPFNDKKLGQFKKIKKYVSFATDVGKIKSVFKNVLIISKDNFLRVLNEQTVAN